MCFVRRDVMATACEDCVINGGICSPFAEDEGDLSRRLVRPNSPPPTTFPRRKRPVRQIAPPGSIHRFSMVELPASNHHDVLMPYTTCESIANFIDRLAVVEGKPSCRLVGPNDLNNLPAPTVFPRRKRPERRIKLDVVE